MSIWGKLGGGSIGLTVGGPLGALLGAFVGHYLVDRQGALLGPSSPDVVLTTGLIALAAKMARADGVVADSEIAAFTRVVSVPAAERAAVSRLFRLAQATTDGYEAYARQLAAAFDSEPLLLDDVLDGLFMIAKADGAVHEAEIAFLRRVAEIFGRTPQWFETVLARHVVVPGDPYRILGVEHGMAWPEIKQHYRRLASEIHPDRAIARGLPPEAVRIATERLAAINAAFERIEGENISREKPRE